MMGRRNKIGSEDLTDEQSKVCQSRIKRFVEVLLAIKLDLNT